MSEQPTTALELVRKIVKYNTTTDAEGQFIFNRYEFYAMFSRLINHGILNIEVTFNKEEWDKVETQLNDFEQEQMGDLLLNRTRLDPDSDTRYFKASSWEIAEILAPWVQETIGICRLLNADREMEFAEGFADWKQRQKNQQRNGTAPERRLNHGYGCVWAKSGQ
jgi:hypothetical protein